MNVVLFVIILFFSRHASAIAPLPNGEKYLTDIETFYPHRPGNDNDTREFMFEAFRRYEARLNLEVDRIKFLSSEVLQSEARDLAKEFMAYLENRESLTARRRMEWMLDLLNACSGYRSLLSKRVVEVVVSYSPVRQRFGFIKRLRKLPTATSLTTVRTAIDELKAYEVFMDAFYEELTRFPLLAHMQKDFRRLSLEEKNDLLMEFLREKGFSFLPIEEKLDLANECIGVLKATG